MIDVLVATTEQEPSKTLYFVAGGALALWAIGISVLGYTRPAFPTTTAQSQAVMALSVALTLFVVAATLITS